MADTAAHLVDRVLPDVPVRHWVLSVPHALRYIHANQFVIPMNANNALAFIPL